MLSQLFTVGFKVQLKWLYLHRMFSYTSVPACIVSSNHIHPISDGLNALNTVQLLPVDHQRVFQECWCIYIPPARGSGTISCQLESLGALGCLHAYASNVDFVLILMQLIKHLELEDLDDWFAPLVSSRLGAEPCGQRILVWRLSERWESLSNDVAMLWMASRCHLSEHSFYVSQTSKRVSHL